MNLLSEASHLASVMTLWLDLAFEVSIMIIGRLDIKHDVTEWAIHAKLANF